MSECLSAEWLRRCGIQPDPPSFILQIHLLVKENGHFSPNPQRID